MAPTISSISGPLIISTPFPSAFMHQLVHIGPSYLLGEIIRISSSSIYIQCYEVTSGLRSGDLIHPLSDPLSVSLGPSLLGGIFDGIQRPLDRIYRKNPTSFYIPEGNPSSSNNKGKNNDVLEGEYFFEPLKDIKEGTILKECEVFGVVKDKLDLKLRIEIDSNINKNNLRSIKVHSIVSSGKYSINHPLITYSLLSPSDSNNIKEQGMVTKWPVRKPRPIKNTLNLKTSLITGQRVLDLFFPAARGSSVCIPGAFGCGKTVISQALSKYSNVDVVVYVGCGERGNEMAEVLADFSSLKLPSSSSSSNNSSGEERSVLDRTVIVANTSNMPVAAREASIYTGATIAEYFRDSGYNAVLLADSTSRWAEALREMGGRLGEMPADGGYPAYLSARISQFYARASAASTLTSINGNEEERFVEGSVSIVGAVSPPGGDFSDPVTAATLSTVQVFWGLDRKLAQKKHFPAINYRISYSTLSSSSSSSSNDSSSINSSKKESVKREVGKLREIMNKEEELLEIVSLVGKDSLSCGQKLLLMTSKMIKEDFLQQNSYSEYDKYCEIEKSEAMAKIIYEFYCKGNKKIEGGDEFDKFAEENKKIVERISWMKFKNWKKEEDRKEFEILEADIGRM